MPSSTPFSLEYALHHAAWLFQHCRIGTRAHAAAEEQMRIATEQGFVFWHATGSLFAAGGLLLQGQMEPGLRLLQKGFEAYRSTGAELAVPFYLSLLADGYTQTGRFPEARLALSNALALAEKNDERFQEAELHRLKGELFSSRIRRSSGGRGVFPPGRRDCPTPTEQSLGIAGHDEPGPTLAKARPLRRSVQVTQCGARRLH